MACLNDMEDVVKGNRKKTKKNPQNTLLEFREHFIRLAERNKKGKKSILMSSCCHIKMLMYAIIMSFG